MPLALRFDARAHWAHPRSNEDIYRLIIHITKASAEENSTPLSKITENTRRPRRGRHKRLNADTQDGPARPRSARSDNYHEFPLAPSLSVILNRGKEGRFGHEKSRRVGRGGGAVFTGGECRARHTRSVRRKERSCYVNLYGYRRSERLREVEPWR
ncbi:hypothetical protein EVAR_98342_1 [Eumeta japonica]|uniref:Uncharacterized protein n=1 Tax=Eumeta variegata TaxID=151549 RepID=A0A4C1XDE4_EUMVA|nr:hypothetical protein EVAR_98342_1 [Eumeta japonica]